MLNVLSVEKSIIPSHMMMGNRSTKSKKTQVLKARED